MSNQGEEQRGLAWAQVDVFADAPFQGNMLAIFTDATGLTEAAMQALARETNLSETTFIFPRDPATEQEKGIRVRIFTMQEELPFAGHPTLGTASWLRFHRPALGDADRIALQLNVGRVEVHFPEAFRGNGGLLAEMLQPEPHFLGSINSHHVAEALGLAASQMHASLAPQVVSTGLPFLIAPLASCEALTSIRPAADRMQALLAGAGAKFVYYIAAADETTWHARLPLYGGEDPATGSAAGCAVSYLVKHGAATPDAWLTLLQGQFVQRPSRILGVRLRWSREGPRSAGARLHLLCCIGTVFPPLMRLLSTSDAEGK